MHRDLKSENVLVWRLPAPFSSPRHHSEVHVKLADYGISRSTLPTGAKGFGGTEGFMAPEIVRHNGEEEYTEKVRSNVISLKLAAVAAEGMAKPWWEKFLNSY